MVAVPFIVPLMFAPMAVTALNKSADAALDYMRSHPAIACPVRNPRFKALFRAAHWVPDFGTARVPIYRLNSVQKEMV